MQFFYDIIDNPSNFVINPIPCSINNSSKDISSDLKNSVRSFSSLGDEDYHKLIEESDVLAKTLSYQKGKIAQICEKVKDSMNKSRNMLDSPLGIRPASCIARYERSYSNSPSYFNQPIIEEIDEGKKY